MKEEIDTVPKESLTNRLSAISIKMKILLKSSEMKTGLRPRSTGIQRDGKKEESTNALLPITESL